MRRGASRRTCRRTISFQTKAEIALALLDEATACGVEHACVTGDADYGDNPNFLNGLEERGERHVVAVRANFSVTLGRGPSSPGRRADEVLAAQPLQHWHSPRVERRGQRVVAREVSGPAVLAGRWGWHSPRRLADRATAWAGAARRLEVFLE